jgi:large subunit ribosomal protein L30
MIRMNDAWLGAFIKMAKQIKVKLVKSGIGRPEKHRKILNSLGLKKLNKVVTVYDTPQIMGAINKVSHLVEIIES